MRCTDHGIESTRHTALKRIYRDKTLYIAKNDTKVCPKTRPPLVLVHPSFKATKLFCAGATLGRPIVFF